MSGAAMESGSGGATRPATDAIVLIHAGYTVLCSSLDGTIEPGMRAGLLDYDTRILSVHRLAIDGEPPRLITQRRLASDRWVAALQHPLRPGTAQGPALPQDALTILVERRIASGLLERLTVVNHSMSPTTAAISLELDADFADASELPGSDPSRGTIERHWDRVSRTLEIRYAASRGDAQFERGLRVRVVDTPVDLSGDEGGVEMSVHLEPRGSATFLLRFESLVDGAWRRPPDGMTWAAARPATVRQRRRTRLEGSDHLVVPAFERAADDLAALRNTELETVLDQSRGDAWLVNAGVPTFTGLFGRDSITAAWQGAMLGPEMMRGAMAWCDRTQGTEDSSWRDEEPGKMIHEMRRGPLAELGLTPQRAYYGTQTTSAMFVLALSEYWHWTGDDAALRRHRDAALRTFEWADRFGDRDGDGFLEYERRSPKGLKNQGWKDSDEAIRYPDGTLVPNPIATVEEQAFHILARERMAEILIALGDDEAGLEFLRQAGRARKRWDEAFWMADEAFYALALDPDKRQVATITSNPGHALGTGVIPRSKARAVADRLLSADLFSGWGVRTLSDGHPSYNPLAYHLGSVWPVENATFALGLKRYGLDEHLDRLVEGMLGAAAGFDEHRLPEAIAGYGRDEMAFPVPYPASNSPQAWSASAMILMLQSMLGIYPFAPLGLLALVRPRLPASTPTVTIRDLRVGNARVALRFTRRSDGTAHHEVLARRGDLLVIPAPPPQAIDPASTRELMELEVLRRAPLRRARAFRVALGLEGAE